MEVPVTVNKTAGFVTVQEHFTAYCSRREVMAYRNMHQYAELHVSLTRSDGEFLHLCVVLWGNGGTEFENF
jgi:hypothetical protein